MKTKILLFSLAVFASTSLFAVTHGSIIKKSAPLDVIVDAQWGDGTPFSADAIVDFKAVTIGGKLWAKVVGTGYALGPDPWSSQVRIYTPDKHEISANNDPNYITVDRGTNTTIVTAYPFVTINQISVCQDNSHNYFNGTEIWDYDVDAPNSGLTGDTQKPVLTKANIGTQLGSLVQVSCSASDNSGDYFYLVTDVANNFSYASFTDDFTVTGLTDGITYALSVVAVDFSGNESTGITSAVTGVTISPETLSITDATNAQLTATVSPADAPDKTVTWSSSNTDVATVSETGLVTGVAVGNATITVTTTSGSKTATCSVTVTTSAGTVTHGSIIKKNTPLNVVVDAQWGDGTPFSADAIVDFKAVTIGGKLWAKVVGTGYALGPDPWSSQVRIYTPDKHEISANNDPNYITVDRGTNTTIVTAYPFVTINQISVCQDNSHNYFNGTEIWDYDVDAPNSGLTGDTQKPVLTKANIGTQLGSLVQVSCSASDNSGDYFYLVTDVANNFSYASFTDDFTVTGLTDGTTYTLSVVAVDFSGNESGLTTSVKETNKTKITLSQNNESIVVNSPEMLRSVKLYSINGQLITSTTLTNIIVTSNLAKGVYVLKVQDIHGTTNKFKVVVR